MDQLLTPDVIEELCGIAPSLLTDPWGAIASIVVLAFGVYVTPMLRRYLGEDAANKLDERFSAAVRRAAQDAVLQGLDTREAIEYAKRYLWTRKAETLAKLRATDADLEDRVAVEVRAAQAFDQQLPLIGD